MPRSAGFLHTIVGRRLFGRFLLAAFLPATLTAALAHFYVKDQLRGELENRVSRSAKLAGLNTLGALQRLEEGIRSHQQQELPADAFRSSTRVTGSPAALRPPPGFESFEYRAMAEGVPPGPSSESRLLSVEEREHLDRGKTLIVVTGDASPATVFMGLRDSSGVGRLKWGRLESAALWRSTVEALGADGSQFCVVEVRGRRTPFCDVTPPDDAMELLGDIVSQGGVALASWDDGDTRMRSASRNIFLRYEYGASDWRVIVSETEEAIVASLNRFTATFAGISLLALLSVFFLSHTQIRRSTEPLEKLQEGTRRLVEGDFQTQVQLSSGDEYADLASSFNRMARTLDRQFVSLRSLDALNQAMLGAREVRPVLETALARLGALLPEADFVAAVEHSSSGETEAVLLRARAQGRVERANASFSESDRSELASRPGGFRLAAGSWRRYLPEDPFRQGSRSAFVFPLQRGGKLFGAVAVATPEMFPLSQDDLDAVRRLVDRLVLAVADVQHVLHLDALSSGTLTAFARAIDANSPWTAGHSERVTAVALEIGARLSLSKDDIADLRCGGLLHDIGKIGVPPAILDKAAPLSAAERAIVERHPGLGAEILAPIGAFKSAIPIVRSHHERMDGRGYPDGLAGDKIPYLARVLAVADVYDALVSDRPYRSGLTLVDAIALIERGSGSHFDRGVVGAFLTAARENALSGLLDRQAASAELAQAVVAGRRVMVEAA